jgi:hypothetical protein
MPTFEEYRQARTHIVEAIDRAWDEAEHRETEGTGDEWFLDIHTELHSHPDGMPFSSLAGDGYVYWIDVAEDE